MITDTAEPDMMAIAAAADASPADTTAPDAQTTSSPESKPNNGAAPDKADGANKDKPADKNTEKKPTETPEKPGDKKPDEKPETAFTKAQKEADRRDKSWKALEAEKAAFREEKAAQSAQIQGLQRELQSLKEQLSKSRQAPAKPATDEHGVEAETYEKLAKQYEAEGRDEDAKAARARAEKIRAQAPKPETSAPAENVNERWKSPEFQKEWDHHRRELVTADPTLADPKNPVFQNVAKLIADPVWGQFFVSRPDGIKAAVEVGKLMEMGAKAEALQKEIETHKAEVARLTKLLSPRGGLPQPPKSGARKIEDMPPDEAAAAVRAAAEAADRGESS